MVALVFAPELMARAGSCSLRRRATGIWISSVVVLLTMSGLLHAFSPGDPWRGLFLRLDHAAIFIIIAGAFTPIHAILFKGFMRWGVLGLVWITALVGIALKLWWFEAFPRSWGLVLYGGVSALGLVSLTLLIRRLGEERVRALVLCLLAYAIGAMFFVFRWPAGEIVAGVGHHELWHACVLLSIAGHWTFVRGTILGTAELPAPRPVLSPAPARAHPAAAVASGMGVI